MKIIFAILTILVFSDLIFGQQQRVLSKQNKDEKAIRASFGKIGEGWNKGDLSQYLSAYTKDATEMLATGPAGGVQAIEKTMREGFWKSGKPVQILRFNSIVVRMLGKKNALVTGQYILSGASLPDRAGWFTTVWTKTKDGWRMIHDHS